MRTSSIVVVIEAAVIAIVCGCAPYDPGLPAMPFACGTTDPKCPDGYSCVGAVCTNSTTSAGSCTTAFSGVLATWNLAGEPGSQTSTVAMSSAPGVVATSISRSPALMAATGTGSISASNWPTSAQLDATRYFTCSITAPAGCTLDVTSLAIDAKSSTTGPASGSVATSKDAFAQNAVLSTAAPATLPLSVSGATGNLEIRIYGYSASATSGTMRVQNTLSITGSLQ